MTNESLNMFWSFKRLKISISDFEKWIYANSKLENELGSENYLELISLNFKGKNDEQTIRQFVNRTINQIDYKCSCVKLFKIDLIGMGFDQETYIGTFKQIKERGDKYWWLYMSQCTVCETYWLIAQEERQNDDFHLLKLNQEQVVNILDHNLWPKNFDNYEDLLILSKKAGSSVRFIDPLNSSMVFTVIDLVKNRPNINSKEISEWLNVELGIANKICKKAMKRENIKVNIINE